MRANGSVLQMICHATRSAQPHIYGNRGSQVSRVLQAETELQENPSHCTCHPNNSAIGATGKRNRKAGQEASQPMGSGDILWAHQRCIGRRYGKGVLRHMEEGVQRGPGAATPQHGAVGQTEPDRPMGNHARWGGLLFTRPCMHQY